MPLKNLTTLEQRLALLVAMPTETRRREVNKQAIHSLAQELEALGLFVKMFDGNHPSLIATTKKTKKPQIMLVAHIDVVPAAHPSQYEPKITSSKIIGRGSWDMKFAAACYLEFLHEYAEKLHKYDIGIMFTTDEEEGSIDGTYMLLEAGYRAGVALVPDSITPWHVQEKAKGRMELKLKASGLSTHGSRPWDGINAIENLHKLFSFIDKKFPVKNHEDDTITVTEINGGTAVNVIPDEATASLDIRSYSVERFASIIKLITNEASNYGITCTQIHYREPVKINKNNFYVKEFAKTIKSITGEPIRYNQAFGASDASFFERYKVPAIVYSVNGGSQHGPKEYVIRKDLPKFYALIVDYINRIHGDMNAKPLPVVQKKNIFRRMMSRVRV